MPNPTSRRYFDNPLFSFNDTAVILLKTSFMNHEAAISLNEAYSLALTRIDDIELDGGQYPVYIYQNDATRLSYVMLCAPHGGAANPCFDYYDKMVFVRGRDAQQFQRRLYDDLTLPHPEPPAADPLGHSHWELLTLLSQGVFEPATVSFARSGEPVTSLYGGPAASMPPKLQKQLKQLKKFLADLFSTFEWHLTNPDELAEISGYTP